MLSNTITRRIEWGDCDPAGIVYNPNFFSWFDHATAMLYEAAGWPKAQMMHEFRMAGCPLVATSASFLSPCTFGEDVTITSTIAEVGRSSFKVAHVLRRGDRVCVEANETRVWTIRDDISKGIRSAPLPEIVAERFRNGA